MRKLTFVTSNINKAKEVESILKPLGFELEIKKLELEEPQSLDIHTIIKSKTKRAFTEVGESVVIEETALELESLNGFPGPLAKWMLKSVGNEKLASIAISLGNPKVKAISVVAWYDGNQTIIGYGKDEGLLVLPPRGKGGFGWDPIFFIPEIGKTVAELSQNEKNRIAHRGKAWRDLIAKLTQKK